MKYKDGQVVKAGDIFTDGDHGREDIRLKNRAKVMYVDNYQLVWFPLNDFTQHGEILKSNTWSLTTTPIKVELNELTDHELKMYELADKTLNVV
jgi:hypothetical protein